MLIFIFYNFSIKLGHRKNKKFFWIMAMLPIMAFSLIEGMRYGRGVDYLSYKYRFEYIQPFAEPQIVFLWLMSSLKQLEFNYVGAFIVYAFLLITGTFYFLKKTYVYEESQWMYFFAFIALTLPAESLIRQYVAQPFIFSAIPFLFEKRNWWKAAFLTLVAINIHTGVLIQIPVLLISYFFINKTFDWKIWAVSLFFVYYVLPTGILADASIHILQMFHLDGFLASEHVLHYIENSDRWLGEDSVIKSAEQTPLTKGLEFIFEFAVVYVSCKILKKFPNRKVLFVFNIAALGFVLCRMFHGYEIFTRMTQQLYIYWFIPVGYVVYVYRKRQREVKGYFTRKEFECIKSALFILCLYQCMFWCRYIFLFADAKFVWNE